MIARGYQEMDNPICFFASIFFHKIPVSKPQTEIKMPAVMYEIYRIQL